MNILISGATGGIGEKLLKSFVDENQHKLFILSRNLCKASVGEGYETRVGDLLEKNSLIEASKNIDLVIHSAGLTHSYVKKRYFEVNFVGTKNLLEACEENKVKKFIFLSSRVASKEGGAYAESKLLAEKQIEKSKIDWVILSLAEVYGVKKGEAITTLIDQVRNKPFVFIPGDGTYGLCPVSIDDVVAVIEKVVKFSVCNKKYIIAGPEKFSYEEFVDYLSEKLNCKIRKFFIPLLILKTVALIFPQFIFADQIPRLVMKKPSDISLAKKELGFDPVGVERALKIHSNFSG